MADKLIRVETVEYFIDSRGMITKKITTRVRTHGKQEWTTSHATVPIVDFESPV